MSELFVRGTLLINPGKLQEFLAVAGDMMALARRRDTQTTSFDTYLDEKNLIWAALERYPDSEGMLAHYANQDVALRDRLMGLCSPGAADFFGVPSPALIERTSEYARRRLFRPLDAL